MDILRIILKAFFRFVLIFQSCITDAGGHHSKFLQSPVLEFSNTHFKTTTFARSHKTSHNNNVFIEKVMTDRFPSNQSKRSKTLD